MFWVERQNICLNRILIVTSRGKIMASFSKTSSFRVSYNPIFTFPFIMFSDTPTYKNRGMIRLSTACLSHIVWPIIVGNDSAISENLLLNITLWWRPQLVRFPYSSHCPALRIFGALRVLLWSIWRTVVSDHPSVFEKVAMIDCPPTVASFCHIVTG